MEMRTNSFHQMSREFENGYLVEETLDK